MAKSRAFGTIRTLPSGRFQARYWHLGKQTSAGSSFATKADARAWLASVETDFKRGEHFDPGGGSVVFDAYAREWMANRALRPRTRETYDSQLRHILAQFGRAELRAIKPGDVRNWHGRLAKSGLSPNTTAKVYRMFRTLMSTAVDDGLIRSNPVGIKGAAAESTIERPMLSWGEIDRLAQAIEPRFSALVWVAATSALRFGELTGLDRSRVDLENGTVRVDRALAFQKGAGPTLGPPKSDAAYRVVAAGDRHRSPSRAHRRLHGSRPEFTRVHVGTGQPVTEPLLRSLLGARQASSGSRRLRAVPRSSTLRRHARCVVGSVAARSHVAHGPLVQRRIASLPQSRRRQGPRGGQRHRASNAGHRPPLTSVSAAPRLYIETPIRSPRQGETERTSRSYGTGFAAGRRGVGRSAR